MKIHTLAAVAAVSLLTLSACGSGSSSSTAGQAGTSAKGATTGGLHVASTSLGKVVVDGQGRTVYMLSADSKNHATCDASCQHYWPPTASGKASGVTAAVASTSLPGGGSTGTVGGWPVYTYSGDQAAGDVTGEGINEFGGTWYAVSPSGTPVMPGGSSSPSSSSSSSTGYSRGGY
jgi:predicted lipoprotein with Yx(FWY)xxD motif